MEPGFLPPCGAHWCHFYTGSLAHITQGHGHKNASEDFSERNNLLLGKAQVRGLSGENPALNASVFPITWLDTFLTASLLLEVPTASAVPLRRAISK